MSATAVGAFEPCRLSWRGPEPERCLRSLDGWHHCTHDYISHECEHECICGKTLAHLELLSLRDVPRAVWGES